MTAMAKKDGNADKTAFDPDKFMSKTELKAALAVAEGGAIPFAIAMTKDRQGLIWLARHGKPKAMRDALIDEAEKAGAELDDASVRHGRASVGAGSNLVTFKVIKEAPGALWAPIQKRLRTVGYGLLDIVTDTNVDNEADATDTAAAGAAPQSAASGAPAPEAPTPAAPAPAAPAQPPAADPAAALAGLRESYKKLLTAIPAVLAITPALKDNLVSIATAAKAALDRSDIDVARDLIATLDGEIHAAPTRADTTAPNATAIADKARMAWDACLSIAAREAGKLRAEITAAYSGHGFGAEVDAFFTSRIDPAIQRLEDSELVATLAAASRSADPQERRRLLADGVRIVETLQSMIDHDPVIARLDDNPFTSVAIARTAKATLGTLRKTLQSAVG